MAIGTLALVWALGAALVSGYARALGRRWRTGLWLGLLLTPPVALALYIVLGPDPKALARLRAEAPCWWRETELDWGL